MPIKDSDKKSKVSDGLKGLQKLIEVEGHILNAIELLTKVPVNIRTHLGDLVSNLTTAKDSISNFNDDKITALYAAPAGTADVMEPVPEEEMPIEPVGGDGYELPGPEMDSPAPDAGAMEEVPIDSDLEPIDSGI